MGEFTGSWDLMGSHSMLEQGQLSWRLQTPGAHRFLSEAYGSLSGYEIAQTSELLVSQILSPPSNTPLQPMLAKSALRTIDTRWSGSGHFTEFAPLFASDGLGVIASGMAGTQDTLGDEVSATALYRNFSIECRQDITLRRAGYRTNNDLSDTIFGAITTVALSPEFTLFGEYRLRNVQGGDRPLDFNIDDPLQFDKKARSDFDKEIARVQLRVCASQ